MIRFTMFLVALLVFVTPVLGATPQTCVLGPSDGVVGGPPTDDLSTNGQDADTVWKSFRWQAGKTGDIYLFAVRVQSIPGTVTNESLTYAVYEDNAGAMGSLKVWGYKTNYNWHTLGVARHYFDLTNVVTNRTITAGKFYWLAFRTSTDNTNRMYFERQGGKNPLPVWVTKKGVTVPAGNYEAIPPFGTKFSVTYAPNYYGWTAWTIADIPPPPPPPVPIDTIFIKSLSLNSISHGQTLGITGQNFGTKNPALPLIWDDGEDRIVDDESQVLSKGWVDPRPRSGKSSILHRMKYRTSGFRNVMSIRGSKYLAGGHYQTPNNTPPYIGPTAEDYENVMVTVDAKVGKPRWFAMFYYRDDPAFLSPCPPYNNHKMMVVNAGAAGYTGGMNYIGMRGNAASCLDTNPGSRWVYNAIPARCGLGTYPNDYPAVTNPKMQWAHLEERISDDNTLGFRSILVDNVYALKFKNNCPLWFSERFPTGIRSYTIGGYYRWATDISNVSTYRGGVNNFRYFDDVYIDTTLSRVILTNNPVYENSTIIEPQIPQSWSSDQITVKVNLGKLPNNGKAYLFVFDSNDVRSEGVCVGLGTGKCN